MKSFFDYMSSAFGKSVGITLGVLLFANPMFGLGRGDKAASPKATGGGNDIPPLVADHGGPDGGGYYFIDSDDYALNAPTFQWIDVSRIGTPVYLGDDDRSDSISIGFNFTFYDSSYNRVQICSNGWISFGSNRTDWDNPPIPTSQQPNAIMAVWWDDLDPNQAGTIYFYRDIFNGRFIIEFDNVPYAYYPGDTGSSTFEIILHSSGKITYQYLEMEPGEHGLSSATVGIENQDGHIGTQYLFNRNGVHDSLAVIFDFEPPDYGIHNVGPVRVFMPGSIVRTGEPLTPIVFYQNFGLVPETFGVRVIIKQDEIELYNELDTVINLFPDFPMNIIFPVFIPETAGPYQLIALSELDRDEMPVNDTLVSVFEAYDQVIFYDFEGLGYFGPTNDWEFGRPLSGPGMAHSGQYLWATKLAGHYTNGPLLSTLTSPLLALSSNGRLGFWHWYSTESGYDGGNVKISLDNGNSWQVIYPEGGYDGELSESFQNPIGGEEGYYGNSDGWSYASFDLTQYGGLSIRFRFDFGADASLNVGDGWYIDDVTIIGGGGSGIGTITGIVTTAPTGLPIEDALVTAGGVSDTTDVDGRYELDLIEGTYALTARADYHSSLTIPQVILTANDTLHVDMALHAPLMQLDDQPIAVEIVHGESLSVIREIENIGDEALIFNIGANFDGARRLLPPPSFAANPVLDHVRAFDQSKIGVAWDAPAMANPGYRPGEPPMALEFGDELAWFDLGDLTGDSQLLGVVYAGNHFWVSGGNSGGQPNYLYKIDRSGHLVNIYEQGTDGWGWLDLAWDGEFIYGTDFSTAVISQFDPATGDIVGTITNPSAAGLGLAYDPATDHFWGVYWWGSSLTEFDRNGAVIGNYPQSPLTAIFGLAWDDRSPDGPWLWVFSQEPGAGLTIAQFDPINHEFTGTQFQAIDHSPDGLAGGLDFTGAWDLEHGILACLGQGQSDWLAIYEIIDIRNWLNISPLSGILSPSQSENVTINLDMTDVPDSISALDAIISILSNSLNNYEIDVHVDLRVGIEEDKGGSPTDFELGQNYPNPFNNSTEIGFALPAAGDVELSVYNILGQKIVILASGRFEAGTHKVHWDASSVASGIYYYKLTTSSSAEVRQMTLIK